MNILVVDIGGTNAKILCSDQTEVQKFPTGPEMTPDLLVSKVRELMQDHDFDVVSIGFPGVIEDGKLAFEPFNLGHGWVEFDFAAAFDKPVKLINDAAMQALGSYEGGRMLYLGLGTGVGSAMIVGRTVIPLDLGQLPFKKGRSLNDSLSKEGYERLGKRRWTEHVNTAVAMLQHCFHADYVMLGGGNAKKLESPPPGSRIGGNDRAILGGYRLWNMNASLTPTSHPPDEAVEEDRSDWKLA